MSAPPFANKHTPIPAVVREWIRNMGPLHVLIGRLKPSWNDLTITNLTGGPVDAQVRQTYKDGNRVISLVLVLQPPPDPAQLALALAPILALPAGVSCKAKTGDGRTCKSNSRPYCNVLMVDGEQIVMCSFHAHRAVRIGTAVSFDRITGTRGSPERVR